MKKILLNLLIVETIIIAVCLSGLVNPLLYELNMLDKHLMLILNYDGGQVCDNFWVMISSRTAWIPLTAALLFTFINYRKNFLIPVLIIAGLALTVTISDQISSSIIKPYVMRLRPSHTEEIYNLLHFANGHRGGQYGFVSSHAANALGVATFLAPLFRNKTTAVILFIWSILVCYSRIYLGVHYPGDVVCGGILGITVGLAMSIAMRYAYIKISQIRTKIRDRYELNRSIETMPITVVIYATGIYMFIYSFRQNAPFSIYDIMLYN